jgi:transposase-like protein
VAYTVECAADGESHRRIAKRLGLCQATVSRWLREAHGGRGGFRSVAIVPSGRKVPVRATSVSSSLRLLTPRGFIVEGLEPELLVSLLRMLG